ncbi:MauE/DoxX family redox-associated membrane protein [Idiomarina xiamenensis]|uniref:Methylamine utilization protein MauE n=1 Tax=Idiomarina xiamenensis 10-D-4 TaxID=740709 RepID=K2KIG3_9GAMM|nr:MauE/DoxX family redox-associated membrane protein [Idiomarina xiamenensis]EKE87653.1 hypothetical protein A10D4_01125 [Idiomarina xiamenensis 10-D-4]
MSFALFCHYLLAWVLAIAALQKCRSWRQFVANLQQLLPMPYTLAALFSALLIATEVLLAIMLWLPGAWWNFSAGLTLVLFIGFSGFIIWLLRSGRRFSCQCFGHSQQPLGKADLYRSVLLLALAIAMLSVEQAALVAFSVAASGVEQLLLISCALLWALQLIALPQWWSWFTDADAVADDKAGEHQ